MYLLLNMNTYMPNECTYPTRFWITVLVSSIDYKTHKGAQEKENKTTKRKVKHGPGRGKITSFKFKSNLKNMYSISPPL